MNNRHDGGAQLLLELWNVKEEDGGEHGEDGSWEKIPVPRFPIEKGRLLEDGETAGTRGHEIEPLPEINHQALWTLN